MTRSEAILLVTNCTINSYDYGNLKFAVDKIYNDFENQNKKLEEFTFTSCDDCKHKIDGHFQEECVSCKRYYACHFEKKQ